MSHKVVWLLAAWLVVSICSCDKRAAKPARPALSKADRARALALAPSGGSSAVDREIALARTRAQAANASAEAWVFLARAWVKKARSASDSGAYLSAQAAADVALTLTPQHGPALAVKALALLSNHRFR